MGELNRESAPARALREARAAVSTKLFGVVEAGVLLVVGAVAAALVSAPTTSTVVQIAVPVAAGVGAMALPPLLVLGGWLILAPIRQRNEVRDELDSHADVPRVDLELALRTELQEGESYLTWLEKGIGFADSDREWVEAWERKVAQLLAERGSKEEAKIFLGASSAGSILPQRLREKTEALQAVIDLVADRG